MSIIENNFKFIRNFFELNCDTFKKRKEDIKKIKLSRENWSSSYLEFFTYEYEMNQLKSPKVYKVLKSNSIHNNYIDEKLVYSFNSENEKWGTVFIDYYENHQVWLLFALNSKEEMSLTQIKVKVLNGNNTEKILIYVVDDDLKEESLFVDLYHYNLDNKISKIERHGFYEKRDRNLPVREFLFIYNDETLKIDSKQEVLSGEIKMVDIYTGKIKI